MYEFRQVCGQAWLNGRVDYNLFQRLASKKHGGPGSVPLEVRSKKGLAKYLAGNWPLKTWEDDVDPPPISSLPSLQPESSAKPSPTMSSEAFMDKLKKQQKEEQEEQQKKQVYKEERKRKAPDS